MLVGSIPQILTNEQHPNYQQVTMTATMPVDTEMQLRMHTEETLPARPEP